MFKNKLLTGFLFAALVACLIRLPFFGQIPEGLNRDEAALGYNAFSLLKTGKDEYGTPFPVSFPSFGDQKLPGYIYTSVPFVATFGLSPISIKLPSLLAGLGVIALVGYLATHLEQQLKFKKPFPIPLSWLAMLLVAISPWGNHFSRLAYEAHLAMHFFLVGLTAAITALHTPTKRQRFFLILSALGFSASLLTYHSYHIFTPLMIGTLAWIFWPKIMKADRIGLIAGAAIGTLTIALMFFGGVWSANQVKIAGISPFSDLTIKARYSTIRDALPGKNALPNKLLVNSTTEKTIIFGEHVAQASSYDFFFTPIGTHHVHNPAGISNLHLFIAPFVLLGFVMLWNHRQHALARVVLCWLVAALIAPSLTITPQHTVRLSPLFPALELTAALGILLLWQDLANKKLQRSLFLGLVVFVAIFSTLRLMGQYLYLSPKIDREHSHLRYHILADNLKRLQSEAPMIYTHSPESSPYIWYLFDHRVDPKTLQQNIERYPADKEGFIHVRRVENIVFTSFNWSELLNQHGSLIVAQPKEIPDDKRTSEELEFREAIKHPITQETLYEVWRVR